MLIECWSSVCDAAPTLNQHWFTSRVCCDAEPTLGLGLIAGAGVLGRGCFPAAMKVMVYWCLGRTNDLQWLILHVTSGGLHAWYANWAVWPVRILANKKRWPSTVSMLDQHLRGWVVYIRHMTSGSTCIHRLSQLLGNEMRGQTSRFVDAWSRIKHI